MLRLKAISPMIAVILLIAFTVAIGGILSVWLTGLQQQQTTATGEYAEKVAKCASVSLSLTNITKDLFQVSYESGTYNLTEVKIVFVNNTGGTKSVMCPQSTLSPGDICVIDASKYINGTITSARAIGICLGEVAKVAEWQK